MPYIRQWCNKLTFGRGDLDRRDSGDIVEGPEKRRFSTMSGKVDCRQNRITSGKRRSKENIILGGHRQIHALGGKIKWLPSSFSSSSVFYLQFPSPISRQRKAMKEKDGAHFSSEKTAVTWPFEKHKQSNQRGVSVIKLPSELSSFCYETLYYNHKYPTRKPRYGSFNHQRCSAKESQRGVQSIESHAQLYTPRLMQQDHACLLIRTAVVAVALL